MSGDRFLANGGNIVKPERHWRPQQQSGWGLSAGRVSADLQPLDCGPGRDRHATQAVEHQVRSFFGLVAEMFEAWLQRRENKNTQRACRADVMDFVSFLGIQWPDQANRLLRVTVPDVQAWRTSCRRTRTQLRRP